MFLVSNPKVEIKNEAMLEKIFSHLYFQDRESYTPAERKKYIDKVVSKCKNIDNDNTIEFGETKNSNSAELKGSSTFGTIVLDNFTKERQVYPND